MKEAIVGFAALLTQFSRTAGDNGHAALATACVDAAENLIVVAALLTPPQPQPATATATQTRLARHTHN